ncbi:MAG: winged helix DNA-binding protein [Pseudomonadota bacterium]
MTGFSQTQVIQDLIDRLTRLNAAEEWNGPLNPSQFAALSYLSRANRFSRAPSHVADYLATTRGTASQTLKALARKDLIAETRSDTDKRSIRYDITSEGSDVLKTSTGLSEVIDSLGLETSETLANSLKTLVLAMLQHRGGRSFGICNTCKHHQTSGTGGYCQLLEVSLSGNDAVQICHEHAL